MTDIFDRTLSEHAAALARREYSAVELARAYFEKIRREDGEIGAYLSLCEEEALAAAEKSDLRRARGEEKGILDGIPFSLKDNICTEGIRTTCASRMLEHYVPPYNAHVTERLSAAGGILLGKVNMDEFGMGASTEHSALGVTRNPRDLSRVPGGSSGGSAAAVAGGLAAFALGSDTGGSVRQPAAFCGVVGLKPTYGAVSRYGLVAFASSLEQIGPLSRDVRDNAAVFGAIVGRDARDARSLPYPHASVFDASENGVRGLRIGLVRECFGEEISADVRAATEAAAEDFRAMGATVFEVSLPSVRKALAAYYILSSAEASSNLGRFDGVRFGHRTAAYADVEELYCRSRAEGFGTEVKRRILMGTFVLSDGYFERYYERAERVRALLSRELSRAFLSCDLLLSPTAPSVAYRFGEKKTPTETYAGDLCTVFANVAGLPALSIPCGTGEGGMPVGLQLVGEAFSEPLLYRAAYAYESLKGGREDGNA